MIWLLICLVLIPFSIVLLVGAPYLPTRQREITQALDMLDIKKGEVFVDLGSGDGAVLLAAARRGLVCYGYELNPLLWCVAWLRTVRYRRYVRIYCRDFWSQKLPKETKGVFVFLLDKYMKRLDHKLASELPQGASLVSYTFQIPGKEPSDTIDALYLYRY